MKTIFLRKEIIKMYAVEIYDRGKYNNIEGTFRLFLTKKGAIKFSDMLEKDNCNHKISKIKRISRDCFSSYYSYYKEIDMIDYEEFDELSEFKSAILKFLKIYDRDTIIDYIYG